ncbi:MAG: peptidylprolyl isomerase [Dysgonamonadaceae bacterium]|jgi:peptidyl-prolyl cis-trans isomerase SurA|nr:peptidylprolyl isomerase [Dysgonamonadaceae bacterium]
MKKYFLPSLMMITGFVTAQTNDPVVMTINGNDVRKSEFEYVYNKNNNAESIDRKSLEDYVELFKNFKLKVQEAKIRQLDTIPEFINEQAAYRRQLAKPYLDSLETDIHLIRKEYDRMKSFVEISHILLPFQGALNNKFKIFPADTVEVYKKAVQVYNHIRNGESFDQMVQEYSLDDQSKANNGYLGWFSGLQLNLNMEDVVFDLQPGEVGIARSNFGYHILKVLNKMDNPGQVKASHILIRLPNGADPEQVAKAENKIDSIYLALSDGADFAGLAKETSDDKGTAARGGELNWFGYRDMVKEFRDEVFALKNIGDITHPFKSQFGFHVAQLTGKKPLEPFEEKQSEIENLLKRSGLSVALYQPAVERLKKEFGFFYNEQTRQNLVNSAITLYPTDSLFAAAYADSKTVLFNVNDTVYTAGDFIRFLKKEPHSPNNISTELLEERLKAYEYSVLLDALNRDLENRYPEFANLIREFYDGSLMFEICKTEVWDKASFDTAGLQKFFEDNRQLYIWDEPYYKGYIVFAKDAKTAKKMQKKTAKKNTEEAVNYLNEKYKTGEALSIKIEKGLFKKGENPFVDEQAFKSGKAETLPEGFGSFFLVGKTLNAPEEYTDTRGMVVTDYQDYLEEIWLKELNEKYPVEIHDILLNRE